MPQRHCVHIGYCPTARLPRMSLVTARNNNPRAIFLTQHQEIASRDVIPSYRLRLEETGFTSMKTMHVAASARPRHCARGARGTSAARRAARFIEDVPADLQRASATLRSTAGRANISARPIATEPQARVSLVH